MATITAVVHATSETTQVDVTITSTTVISDPVAYVQTSLVAVEILARAGLSADLTFVSATIQSTTTISTTYYYNLLVVYGDTPTNTTTHTHDYTTLTFPLRESYRDGTTIDLDATLGPVAITAANDTTVDYLRVRTDLGTTARDIFYIQQGSIVRWGGHHEYYLDATYDIGTPDAGVTLRRPRDLWLSRDVQAGRNAVVTGSGTFGTYVVGTHYRFTGQAVNPDTTPTNQHLYVNSTDASLRYWDGSSETTLVAGTTSDTTGLFDCPAGVVVGEVVYIIGVDYVVQASASTLAGNTVAGVVVSKPTATTANVKYAGEASVFVGLNPGALYFLSRTTGAITTDVSAFITGDTMITVGVAKNTTTLVVRIGEPFSV